MSGTSMDGIDAALIHTDGDAHIQPQAFATFAYDAEMKARLRAAMSLALELDAPCPHPEIDALATALADAHARAVTGLLAEVGQSCVDIDLIGYHGQTIAHRPERGWTWQIGRGDLVARATGVPVVEDFRSADVAAGGQGAPLAPLYHRQLVANIEGAKNVVILNIGGVANMTWIGPNGEVLALDTGPGNGLVDDFMRARGQGDCDLDGACAARGRAHTDRVDKILAHPWFDMPPPKSLDRKAFDLSCVTDMSLEDGAATLTLLTARTVARAIADLCTGTPDILVTGGGRHNPTMMQMLRDCSGLAVDPVERVGWDGDALEAQCFAWLAARFCVGAATALPCLTGAARETSGGRRW